MKLALASILALFSPLAFAAINLSLSGLVELVIYLLIVGGIVWLLLFIVGKVGPPEPFAKVITIIIYVVAALLLINLLLGFLARSRARP
jgi:hypothetical protein